MPAFCCGIGCSGSPSPAGLVQALQSLEPDALCLGVTTRDNLERVRPHLEALASQARRMERPPMLVMGGQGILADEPPLPRVAGFEYLPERADVALAAILARLEVRRPQT